LASALAFATRPAYAPRARLRSREFWLQPGQSPLPRFAAAHDLTFARPEVI